MVVVVVVVVAAIVGCCYPGTGNVAVMVMGSDDGTVMTVVSAGVVMVMLVV